MEWSKERGEKCLFVSNFWGAHHSVGGGFIFVSNAKKPLNICRFQELFVPLQSFGKRVSGHGNGLKREISIFNT
jgi:hypothetical protein